MKIIFLVLSVLLIVGVGGARAPFAVAADDASLTSLQDTIKEKQGSLGEVNARIGKLEKEAEALRKKAKTLQTQTAILENRIAKIGLDIEATRLQRETIEEEISVIDRELDALAKKASAQRAALASVLREMQTADNTNRLFLVFSTDTFSSFFDRLRSVERLNRKLSDGVEETRSIEQQTETYREQKEEKLVNLQTFAEQLALQQEALSSEQSAKIVLLASTRESEASYQQLLRDLEEEQKAIASEINALQADVESRLAKEDREGGSSSLSWPLDADHTRITTLFRDPTYPFRYLFEHSGIDLPAATGSAVRSAAPGYVAWTRTGRQYGNYMMVIHANGLATLYAHLSAFVAKPDQFVNRGEVIARSGGARGAPGAGLSTGPHLHFEVRLRGIPVNPLSYVLSPSL